MALILAWRKPLKSVLPLARDLEVVRVILPFIVMCPPGFGTDAPSMLD